MDKKVYACSFGTNIPRDSKANTDKTPTQAIVDYCKSDPDVDFIPMAATGHNAIDSWSYIKRAMQPGEPINTVDAVWIV